MEPQVEIVDDIFAPRQENPYSDRITSILKQRAQPQQFDPWQVEQAGRAAMVGAGYNDGQGVQQILDAVIGKPLRESQDRELDSHRQLYDMFEQKRSQGDRDANALFEKMNMFTGGDPEGNSKILEALHADPEKLDPHNAVQIYSKIGGIVKRMGYQSPDMLYKKAQINSMNALSRQRTNGPAKKPMPAAALRLQQDAVDAIGTAGALNADLGAIADQLTDKKLPLGLVDNMWSRTKNFTGYSDEGSKNFASFQATLEKLRNDSLRLNKGVQTEGDSQRAWDELLANINDEDLVLQRIEEIKRINDRGALLQQMNLDNIRSNYGHDPLDLSAIEKPPPALNGGSTGGGLTPEKQKRLQELRAKRDAGTLQ